MATVLPDLSRGPVLLSVSVGTASFAFSTTIIRFCVRTRISNDFGPDDYAMGAATVRYEAKWSVKLLTTLPHVVDSVYRHNPQYPRSVCDRECLCA